MADRRKPVRTALIEDVLEGVRKDAGDDRSREEVVADRFRPLRTAAREDPVGCGGAYQDVLVGCPGQGRSDPFTSGLRTADDFRSDLAVDEQGRNLYRPHGSAFSGWHAD